MSIKNVAIIGGGGNLGSSVLKALLDAKFTVTVITRKISSGNFPSGVRVQKTDFTSPESLAEAFKNQDAVVDAGPGQTEQHSLIDAAVKAGVKRWIPSEFGVNTRLLGDSEIGQILSPKIKTVDYLKTVAAVNPSFTWTGLSTGWFFDWGLKGGFSRFSIKDKTATIVDSGNEPNHVSNLSTVGIAVVLILTHLDETANKYLPIASLTVTQNEILSVLEEETGTKWTVNNVKSEDLLKQGREKLSKGDYSSFVDFLQVLLYRDGKGQARISELANAVIGLPNDDLRETIRDVLK